MNTRIFVLLLATITCNAQADTVYIAADTLFTSGPAGIVENGAVLVQDGKITAVGPQGDIKAPEDATRVKASVVIPGLIDSHTVVGVNGGYNLPQDQDGFEQSVPTGAQFRVLDSFNPSEKLVAYAASMGTTSVHVTPQPTAPIGGSTAVLKTRGTVADEMLVKSDAAVLFNLGEAPKAAFKKTGPTTRMATAASIRDALYQARAWQEKPDKKRQPDLGSQALARVLDGEALAVFTAHREDDIATALRIAEEFGLRAVINYGTESYLMRSSLAEAEATVVLAPTMQRVSGMEKRNSSLEVASYLNDANVNFVFGSGFESYVPKSRVLLWEIAIAVANGLPAEKAISAATIEAARLWGVDQRIGSLERGKDADIVLFDGDPFEYTSHIIGVMIDGKLLEKRI